MQPFLISTYPKHTKAAKITKRSTKFRRGVPIKFGVVELGCYFMWKTKDMYLSVETNRSIAPAPVVNYTRRSTAIVVPYAGYKWGCEDATPNRYSGCTCLYYALTCLDFYLYHGFLYIQIQFSFTTSTTLLVNKQHQPGKLKWKREEKKTKG